jgi:hypothetical protein
MADSCCLSKTNGEALAEARSNEEKEISMFSILNISKEMRIFFVPIV